MLSKVLGASHTFERLLDDLFRCCDADQREDSASLSDFDESMQHFISYALFHRNKLQDISHSLVKRLKKHMADQKFSHVEMVIKISRSLMYEFHTQGLTGVLQPYWTDMFGVLFASTEPSFLALAVVLFKDYGPVDEYTHSAFFTDTIVNNLCLSAEPQISILGFNALLHLETKLLSRVGEFEQHWRDLFYCLYDTILGTTFATPEDLELGPDPQLNADYCYNTMERIRSPTATDTVEDLCWKCMGTLARIPCQSVVQDLVELTAETFLEHQLGYDNLPFLQMIWVMTSVARQESLIEIPFVSTMLSHIDFYLHADAEEIDQAESAQKKRRFKVKLRVPFRRRPRKKTFTELQVETLQKQTGYLVASFDFLIRWLSINPPEFTQRREHELELEALQKSQQQLQQQPPSDTTVQDSQEMTGGNPSGIHATEQHAINPVTEHAAAPYIPYVDFPSKLRFADDFSTILSIIGFIVTHFPAVVNVHDLFSSSRLWSGPTEVDPEAEADIDAVMYQHLLHTYNLPDTFTHTGLPSRPNRGAGKKSSSRSSRSNSSCGGGSLIQGSHVDPTDRRASSAAAAPAAATATAGGTDDSSSDATGSSSSESQDPQDGFSIRVGGKGHNAHEFKELDLELGDVTATAAHLLLQVFHCVRLMARNIQSLGSNSSAILESMILHLIDFEHVTLAGQGVSENARQYFRTCGLYCLNLVLSSMNITTMLPVHAFDGSDEVLTLSDIAVQNLRELLYSSKWPAFRQIMWIFSHVMTYTSGSFTAPLIAAAAAPKARASFRSPRNEGLAGQRENLRLSRRALAAAGSSQHHHRRSSAAAAAAMGSSSMRWYPFNEVQVHILHSIIFECLTAENNKYLAYQVSAVWNIQLSLLSALGTTEVVTTIPMLLALEELCFEQMAATKQYKLNPSAQSTWGTTGAGVGGGVNSSTAQVQIKYVLLFFAGCLLFIADAFGSKPLHSLVSDLVDNWEQLGILAKDISFDCDRMSFIPIDEDGAIDDSISAVFATAAAATAAAATAAEGDADVFSPDGATMSVKTNPATQLGLSTQTTDAGVQAGWSHKGVSGSNKWDAIAMAHNSSGPSLSSPRVVEVKEDWQEQRAREAGAIAGEELHTPPPELLLPISSHSAPLPLPHRVDRARLLKALLQCRELRTVTADLKDAFHFPFDLYYPVEEFSDDGFGSVGGDLHPDLSMPSPLQSPSPSSTAPIAAPAASAASAASVAIPSTPLHSPYSSPDSAGGPSGSADSSPAINGRSDKQGSGQKIIVKKLSQQNLIENMEILKLKSMSGEHKTGYGSDERGMTPEEPVHGSTNLKEVSDAAGAAAGASEDDGEDGVSTSSRSSRGSIKDRVKGGIRKIMKRASIITGKGRGGSEKEKKIGGEDDNDDDSTRSGRNKDHGKLAVVNSGAGAAGSDTAQASAADADADPDAGVDTDAGCADPAIVEQEGDDGGDNDEGDAASVASGVSGASKGSTSSKGSIKDSIKKFIKRASLVGGLGAGSDKTRQSEEKTPQGAQDLRADSNKGQSPQTRVDESYILHRIKSPAQQQQREINKKKKKKKKERFSLGADNTPQARALKKQMMHGVPYEDLSLLDLDNLTAAHLNSTAAAVPSAGVAGVAGAGRTTLGIENMEPTISAPGIQLAQLRQPRQQRVADKHVAHVAHMPVGRYLRTTTWREVFSDATISILQALTEHPEDETDVSFLLDQLDA